MGLDQMGLDQMGLDQMGLLSKTWGMGVQTIAHSYFYELLAPVQSQRLLAPVQSQRLSM